MLKGLIKNEYLSHVNIKQFLATLASEKEVGGSFFNMEPVIVE